MPPLKRKDKATCEKCGTENTRNIFARHKKRCSVATFIVLILPTSQHVRKLISTFTLQKCIAHHNQKHFTSVNFFIRFLLVFIPCDYIDKKYTTRKVYWSSRLWMWQSCWDRLTTRAWIKNFKRAKILLWTLRWRTGDMVFIFAMNILHAHTLSQKLDTVFDKLKCAAKLNVAFGFVLKNVDDGTCRYFYAHEKNTLMERSKLWQPKKIW